MAAFGSRPVDDGSLVVAGSALLVVAGGFLGWYTVPVGETIGSIDGIRLFGSASRVFNGLVTILLATVVTVLSLFLPDNEGVNLTTAIAGLAVEVIAVAFVVAPEIALSPAVVAEADTVLSSAGPGVFLTVLGGLGIILGGFQSYRD